jgi:CTP synthase (UTP-ammonia lyase)
MQVGIQPDMLICRSEQPLGAEIKRKIALFCNVDFSCVIESPDVKSIYELPLRRSTKAVRPCGPSCCSSGATRSLPPT